MPITNLGIPCLVFALVALAACTAQDAPGGVGTSPGPDAETAAGDSGTGTGGAGPEPQVPSDLALPVRATDLGDNGGFISPFGVVRHSRDQGHGHGGIDVPLDRGDPIYSVADGAILANQPAEDGGGGHIVDVLIAGPMREGEVGWIFKYERVDLDAGLTNGSRVTKGQQIGTSENVGANNHFSLEYVFNAKGYTRDHTWWVDQLDSSGRAELVAEFDAIRGTPSFRDQWRDAQEEGYYNYRGLLDEARFPDGPQLCYPTGTDARVPIG